MLTQRVHFNRLPMTIWRQAQAMGGARPQLRHRRLLQRPRHRLQPLPQPRHGLLRRLFPPGRMSRPRRSRQQPSLLAHPLQQRLVRPTCTATTSKRTGATACAPSVTATTGSTSSYRRAMTAPSTSLPRPTGSTNTKAAGESSVRWEGNHPKIVHHFDNSGGGTHAFRFAKLGRRQD